MSITTVCRKQAKKVETDFTMFVAEQSSVSDLLLMSRLPDVTRPVKSLCKLDMFVLSAKSFESGFGAFVG